MSHYVTIAEAILISMSTVLIWALIKTIIETIDNKTK